MKRILGLTIAALLVISMVGTGTWAYFSDDESSANNSLTAGTLDLNVDDTDSAVTTFSVTEKAPGDSGSGTTTLDNAGSLPGELDIAFSTVTNTPGAGDTQYEGGSGELGGVAEITVYLDLDKSGTFNDGDIELNTGGANAYNASTNTTLDYAIIDSYASVSYDPAIASMAAAASDNFIILWRIPTTADNTIQGDAAAFDVTFTLEQAAAD